MNTTITESTPFKGRCGKCDHIWTIMYLPMPLKEAGELMKRAMCPKCGSKEPLYVARQADDAGVGKE